MTQTEPVSDGVAERANPELQRSPIGQEGSTAKANSVLRVRDGQSRAAEEWKIVGCRFQDVVERRRRQVCLAAHERKLAVDLPDDNDRRTAPAPFGENRKQIERDVWITRQAEARLLARSRFRDKLGDDVEPTIRHITCGMAVVGGDIALLRQRRVEPATGEQKEFVHLDIRRQRAASNCVHIGQARIIGEKAVRQRLGEAAL